MKFEIDRAKVAIIGLGMEGKDALNFFLKNGSVVTIYDCKSELNLDYSDIDKKKINLITGEKYLEGGLSNYDIIVRSPGVYRYLPQIVEAEANGSVITSTTKIFFDLFPGKIIGVTGTKGKGTTSTLIYNILKRSSFDVFLAGNIGMPLLELLNKASKESWAILELSSFQLIDLSVSPHISVVLNITEDHLDWHKSKKEYLDAKKNIVLYQKSSNYSVINNDYQTPLGFASLSKGKKYFFSKKKKVRGSYIFNNKILLNIKGKSINIGNAENLLLRGKHNWENVTAAVCASSLVGVSVEDIKKEVFSFRGLEHRLELVREFDGVKYYNDSFSTNPQTTIAGVRSFNEPITLIMGGSDKGLNYNKMAQIISKLSNIKNIILIGVIADNINKSLRKYKFKGKIILSKSSSMIDIVEISKRYSRQGYVVLLSPASASFDMFLNYKDRGNKYKEAVNNLK